MTRMNCIVLQGFAVAMLAVTACAALPEDGESAAPDPQTGQTTQALTGFHKICSAIMPGNYRDSIEVDDTWTASTCFSWARSVNGDGGTWQLGCIFTNSFTWGAQGGGAPGPSNCGW